MPICAYCGLDKKASREHILPDWYSSLKGRTIVEKFLEANPRKLVNTSYIIVDVCAGCNNGILSQLDDYGKRLHMEEFGKPAFGGRERVLSYDFNLLCRWLLKIAYNAARRVGDYTDFLRPYGEVVLGRAPIPESLVLTATLIGPSRYEPHDDWSLAYPSDGPDGVILPTWFGAGSSRFANPNKRDWAFLDVYLDSYLFGLAIPKLPEAGKVKQPHSITGTRLQRDKGSVAIPAPELHTMVLRAMHLINNPIAYGLEDSSVISEFIKKNAQVLEITLPRDLIESPDGPDALIDFLRYLASNRETAVTFAQKLDFKLPDYADETRPIWEIPEVRDFVRRVTANSPPWIFFLRPPSGWMFVVTACNYEVNNQPEGLFIIAPLVMANAIKRWQTELRTLCEKLQVSEDKWRTIFSEGIEILLPLVKGLSEETFFNLLYGRPTNPDATETESP